MIQFQDVTKRFKQGFKEISVLNNFNFIIEESGTIAIVGKSGCGKSTFLSLLAGLDSPTTGKIFIDKQEITHKSERELTVFRAKNIGFIFQNFNLIESFTVLENVMLPLEVLNVSSPKEKATHYLNSVGLQDRHNHFPDQLSGGEKQRVAIARACVTNPQIILADEPSGNLDPETGNEVMSVLFRTAKEFQQTVILVTHDYELAKKCDHIFEIKNHQIVKL
ncbi:MAG: ABC transporter ATP-binding protein [Halobacteriovoraceae bacterium]|jgi:putative ABC transport system ATP-binding protein|nr:ABC transporter ATP-binding protein [Halobacteriovoraceae bacterium]